jgi:hypothetical protein
MNASHFESLAGLLSPRTEEQPIKESLKNSVKVQEKIKNKNDIWDEDDVEEQLDVEDSRPTPEYVNSPFIPLFVNIPFIHSTDADLISAIDRKWTLETCSWASRDVSRPLVTPTSSACQLSYQTLSSRTFISLFLMTASM